MNRFALVEGGGRVVRGFPSLGDAMFLAGGLVVCYPAPK